MPDGTYTYLLHASASTPVNRHRISAKRQDKKKKTKAFEELRNESSELLRNACCFCISFWVAKGQKSHWTLACTFLSMGRPQTYEGFGSRIKPMS